MININVLDTDFNIIGVIDTYESFIWTDRFKNYGDFELYSGVDSNLLNLCKQDYYLEILESPHLMIIEGIEITTDSEQGNHIRITGRSIESILDRRIIWDQTTVSGTKDHTLKTAIECLFKYCFGFGTKGTEITKKYTDMDGTQKRVPFIRGTVKLTTNKNQTIDVRKERVIRNLLYLRPDDSIMDGLIIEKTQFTGDNLYDIMIEIMDSYSQYGLGYRIIPLYRIREVYTDDYISGHTDLTVEEVQALSEYTFVFELYSGVDRSYEQDIRPYIVFSPDFDNIINTDYLDTIEGYKNVTLILGEGEGASRKRLILGGKDDNNDYLDPLMRRELYTDARDISRNEYGTNANYKAALKQRGLEKLYECTREVTYDGEVEAERVFVYNADFLMGDIIQIKNEYGINGKARVIEYIISESESGRDFYPTFDSVELVNESEDEETGNPE